MKITTTIEKEKVRELCVRMEYCTKATNEQYETMLRNADCKLTESNLEKLANYIAHQSVSEDFMYMYGCTYDEFVESIAFNIANDCTLTTIN